MASTTDDRTAAASGELVRTVEVGRGDIQADTADLAYVTISLTDPQGRRARRTVATLRAS